MTSMAIAVIIAVAQQPAAPSGANLKAGCSWSAIWQEVKKEIPPRAPGDPYPSDPKRKRGSIRRPASALRHVIRGKWTVAAVMGSSGKILDARVIAAPDVTPPWPEYEASVVEQVMKWEYEPARVNGKAVPTCLITTMQDRP